MRKQAPQERSQPRPGTLGTARRPGLRGLLLAGLAGLTLQAAFPGFNGELVFARSTADPSPGTPVRVELFELFPERPEGQRAERRVMVTGAGGPGPVQCLSPAFSPDGSKLAIASQIPAPGGLRLIHELHLISSGGQHLRRLTTTFMAPKVPGSAHWPCWSPDGTRVAYIAGLERGPAHARQLRVVDLAGEKTLAFNLELARPAWSPDGGTLLFTREGQLWTVPSEGGHPRPLTRPVPGSAYPLRSWPAWSPDGRKLVFCQVDAERQPTNLWWMDRDGSHPEPVARGPYPFYSPEWSPDGRKLAYTSLRDGQWELYARNAIAEDTPGPLGPGETRLTFSPAGARVGAPTWRALPGPDAGPRPEPASAAKDQDAAGLLLGLAGEEEAP